MSAEEVKKLEDHYQKGQDEEAKTMRKQISWSHLLALKCVKFVSVTCNASSNNQKGMLENPVIYKLKLKEIVSN